MKFHVWFEATDFPTVEIGEFEGDMPHINDVIAFQDKENKPRQARVLSVEAERGHLYVTTVKGTI